MSNRWSLLDTVLRAIERIRQNPPSVESPVRSWARQVQGIDDLPRVYRPFVEGLHVDSAGPLPYAAVIPGFGGGSGRSETGQLILLLGKDICVVSEGAAGLLATQYPIMNIHLVERGSILLHAWITIRGVDSTGAVHSTTIRFNSVTEHIMAPFLEAMRAPTTAGPRADLSTERGRLGFLKTEHLKFFNYGQASIRPGARVIQCAFQPERRTELVRLFGFSVSRLDSPAQLCILTDSELILLRDDDTQQWSKGAPHGAIWIYVPRRQIHLVSMSTGSDGGKMLAVTLPGDARISAAFEPSQTRAAQEMGAAIQSTRRA